MGYQQIEFCKDREEFRNAFSTMIKGANRLLLLHGHRSYQSCGARDLVTELTETIETVEFEDFTENPKKKDVDLGVTLFNKCKPDVIVAIGGGSVMDMAKLIRYYSSSDTPVLAVPTTAGTGAESTQFAVCYIDGVKHSISDPSILPELVILYPPFTFANSRYLTSCTGFDALAQAIEAYWNINATTESDQIAISAIKKIYPLLIKEYLLPEERALLLVAANEAGKAINITRTTVPHALSYTLTSKYGYPHGHAVALTFPFFLKYYLEGSIDSYRGEDFDRYIEKMDLLNSLLNIGSDPFLTMKSYINQIGLGYDSNRDFDDIVVANGINLERAKNSPMVIDNHVIINAVQSIRE